jgi:pyruvate ferredoxin oxidoreductase gamma subunit
VKEVIIFARAGQGAITTAQILGSAILKSGKYAYAFPHFGAARMGAPMNAFLRYDDRPIRLRSQVKVADYSLIVDETLFSSKNPLEQIRSGGMAIINSEKSFSSEKDKKIVSIPANKISEEISGRQLANTVLLGAFCAVTKEVSIDNLIDAIKERFKSSNLELNTKLVKAGFEFGSKLG